MDLIGLSGQKQNGKDTIVDFLHPFLMKKNPDWRRVAFAEPIKRIVSEIFGISYEDIEKWKVLSEPPPGFVKPLRDLLQYIGDGFREAKPDVWVELAFRNKNVPYIISDVRYVNEIVKIKQEGGINVLVVRPDRVNDDPNGSEASLRPYVDYMLKVVEKYIPSGTAQVFDWRKLNWIQAEKIFGKLPDKIEYFDFFVLNNGTKENLQAQLEKTLCPSLVSLLGD